jgi:hypothetical protein
LICEDSQYGPVEPLISDPDHDGWRVTVAYLLAYADDADDLPDIERWEAHHAV